jgi:hypothetical protein
MASEGLNQEDLERGTKLFVDHLVKLQEENVELSDLHEALEHFCMNKYSLGSSATTQKTGGKGDLGVDFYSVKDKKFHIGQCKIPDLEWLDANPGKVKSFGPSVLNDPKDALRYLLGESKLIPNEAVRHLYALVDRDRTKDEFSLVFFLVVFGRLDKRAVDGFEELKAQYSKQNVSLILNAVDNLVDEFLVGASRSTGEIRVDLRIARNQVLRANDYCYFLANAADLFKAFLDYGWRLFDKNVRYEIRNSPINGDIVEALKHAKDRKRFHHFNNGLIIVAHSYTIRDADSQIRLMNPQIVNGLQTVKSIYNAVTGKVAGSEDLEKECLVQVKVIQTNDPDFVSKVVYATNNQNPMSSRNLKANNREQKTLKTAFATLPEAWFYQVKQGEWSSLTGEEERFFKQVIGFPASHFRFDPHKKTSVRLIDNEDAAKAWLAFIGFGDKAGDRVTHYFSEEDIYQLAFSRRPTSEHWQLFGQTLDFDKGREQTLELMQGDVHQYLLAIFLWEYTRHYIPSPKSYREEGLQEGVVAGKIKKSGGSIVSPQSEQDTYLADNSTYQTWRLMSNMKELIVEAAAHVLTRRYGSLDKVACKQLLLSFDAKDFLEKGEVRQPADHARIASDLDQRECFARLFGFPKHAASQYWEDKRSELAATSRIRTVLLRRSVAAEFKRKLSEINERRSLDKAWKPEGKKFHESLPDTDKS